MGADSVRAQMLVAGGSGEERHDKSTVSISGDARLAATSFEDARARMLATGSTGEDRHDRSRVSTFGDACLVAASFGEVRSKLSTSGDTDFVLRRRGEVHRLRIGASL
jgi:hypothetical protein